MASGKAQVVGEDGAPLNQSSITTYAYDRAGNKVAERFEHDGVVYQDNKLTYDALGRLVDVVDARHHVWIAYDAVGNRRSVKANFIDDDGGPLRQTENWYLYNSMNRMTVENGSLVGGVGGQIRHTWRGAATQGATYTYDYAGNRTSATRNATENNVAGQGGGGNPNQNVTEHFVYDSENRLIRSTQGCDAAAGGSTGRYDHLKTPRACATTTTPGA